MIVSEKGIILKRKFEFNGHSYEIVSSEKNGGIWETLDIVKRTDGRKKTFLRSELKNYFNPSKKI